ncbi:S9 family peptidase [Acidobacteriota bacterium]
MKRSFIIAIIVLLTNVSLAAQENNRRPMTVDDMLEMVIIGNALISPDGHWVFFSKSELDWENNRRAIKYFMIPAEGGAAFQYIGEEGGASFQFSPDGEHISFKRRVAGHHQIFWMRPKGGEAVQLTNHRSSVGMFKWSGDSTKIFFIADEPRSKEEEREYRAGDNVLFVDEGPNGQKEGRWSNLWMFDIKNRKAIKITDEEFILENFDVSYDAKRIVFTARYTNRRNDADKNEVYLIHAAGGEKIRLTQNSLPECSLAWAPDGKSFAYTAQSDKKWLNQNPKIYIMKPDTKEYRLLSKKFEGSITSVAYGPDFRAAEAAEITWLPDGSAILFNGRQGTNSNLFKIDVSTGDFKQLTHVTGTLMVSSFSKDRKKMVYSFSDFDTPDDLYASFVDKFNPVRLTEANPWIEKELLLAKMQLIRWKSKNDFEIEGLFHLPADYKEGTRIPLILNVHGGPANSFNNNFRDMSLKHHVYAGLGYASLSPNVRGTSGYTDRLQEGNTFYAGTGIGYGDFWDLMTGVDKLIKEGYIDPDRMGIRGRSYGAILGGWTITQTQRFKAAVLDGGVYNWASEYGPGFNQDMRLWHIGGTPWDNPEAWQHQSALTHVKNVTSATLLFHGTFDNSNTEPNSMMLLTALKDIGKVPARYIKFPTAGGRISTPRHQRIRDIEEIKWMQKYVLGSEWIPWQRKKKSGAN